MRTPYSTLVIALALLATAAGTPRAADQPIPTKFFVLKDPNGSMPTTAPREKMKWSVKDGPHSTLTIAGDPTAGGAVLFVDIASGSQCFELPKEGWSALGSRGFRYRDPGPDVSPTPDVRGGIKRAAIKLTPSGNFLIKAKAASKTGTVRFNLYGGALRAYFLIRDGDLYCTSGFPFVADGYRYEVKGATAPLSCALHPADTFCSPSGAFLD